MAKYKMEYWFEWGGTCLWSANDAAKKEFGYAVDEQKLPISAKLKNLLWYLQAYHENMMDIDNAPSDSPWWTEEDSIMFEKRRNSPMNSSVRSLVKSLKLFMQIENGNNCKFRFVMYIK